MAVFPTLMELLIPNLNIFTILGIFAFILAGVSFIPAVRGVIALFRISQLQFAIVSAFIGIVLIWGVSMIQDFATSVGGIMILIGVVITLLTYLILFGNPKGKK